VDRKKLVHGASQLREIVHNVFNPLTDIAIMGGREAGLGVLS
jgi:hypothetical protein